MATMIKRFNIVAPTVKEVPEHLAEIAHKVWGNNLGYSEEHGTAPISWPGNGVSLESLPEGTPRPEETLTPNMVIYSLFVEELVRTKMQDVIDQQNKALEVALAALENSSTVFFKDPSKKHLLIEAIAAINDCKKKPEEHDSMLNGSSDKPEGGGFLVEKTTPGMATYMLLSKKHLRDDPAETFNMFMEEPLKVEHHSV